MSIAVLTAVTGAAWEARLVAALESAPGGPQVVRRCVDLADLLATAAAGHGDAVLLSADLRGLDRDALDRLAGAGVAPVGVVPDGDEDAERRLRQLGVAQVVTAAADAAEIAQAVQAAVDRLSHPSGRDAPAGASAGAAGTGLAEFGSGRLVAVWGPTGAPGRTSLALNLAAEMALLGKATLVADVDTYGGAVAQLLGLLDEAPGLAAATRSANNGQLDLPGLARHARQVSSRLRVLTGISRTDRWPEIRPAALEVVWSLARGLAEITVADCGFCLERDEELSFDTSAPRRNGATLATLEQADIVVAVGSADPVGLQRLVRGLSELTTVVPGADVRVVVNRLRASVVGPAPQRQIRDALRRYAGVRRVGFVPDDPGAFDQAVAAGRLLPEAAPSAAARQAIAEIAAELAGVTPAGGHKRRRRVPV